jgi:hypothetical protein
MIGMPTSLGIMYVYWFLLGLLAVWRITNLLSEEDGPWRIVARLRGAVGNGFWGGLVDCFNCMSIWIAAPFALGIGATFGERFCLWLAFSGGAVVLQRLTAQVAPMPAFFEDGDHDNVMLRESKSAESTGHTSPTE